MLALLYVHLDEGPDPPPGGAALEEPAPAPHVPAPAGRAPPNAVAGGDGHGRGGHSSSSPTSPAFGSFFSHSVNSRRL